MADSKADRFSRIVAIAAIAVAGLSFYFQFFHRSEGLSAVLVGATFGEQPVVKYAIINTGDTTLMLLDADAFEYQHDTVSSPYGVARLIFDHPSGTEFPFLVEPGDMRIIGLSFTYSGRDDAESPEREIHFEFDSVDSHGQLHHALDKLIWLDHHGQNQVTIGVHRTGSGAGHLRRPISLLE